MSAAPSDDPVDTPTGPDDDPVMIRLPKTAYLAVVFLLFGAIPLAFGQGEGRTLREVSRSGGEGVEFSWRWLLLLLPVVVAIFIARTATAVSPRGVRIRAALGSRFLPWERIRGLQVSGRVVYAVIEDGMVRLPCVRLAHLGPISRLSGGRLPELPDATPKPAAGRRRR